MSEASRKMEADIKAVRHEVDAMKASIRAVLAVVEEIIAMNTRETSQPFWRRWFGK